jgi:hypothetical protein
VRLSSAIRIPVGEIDKADIAKPKAVHEAARPEAGPADRPEKR